VTALASASRTAAFFDLDGTLIPLPTLERRLLRALLHRHAIPVRNLALWPIEMVRLASHGLSHARQANKMHFRGISPNRAASVTHQLTYVPLLQFFPQALERVAWHASQGHRIALITGAPQLLARCAACALETWLAQRGITTTILVRATILEERAGRWSGRVVGDPMFGRAKALAIDALASRLELDLSVCYAYGDSIDDRQMLDCVGHPAVVNPSKPLLRLARRRAWQIVEWRLPASSVNTRTKISLAKRKVETLG
jgi:HAD superfamily hydrolase (TIGR01490 family)